jgi:hypothetical protein
MQVFNNLRFPVHEMFIYTLFGDESHSPRLALLYSYPQFYT